MKNIFIILSSLLLFTACNRDTSLRKKVPGWYTLQKKLDNDISLSGQLTYYKNGQLTIRANVNRDLVKDFNLNFETTAKGTWKVENGYLKEEITQFITTPQILGDQLLVQYKKEFDNNIGYKILKVDKQELQVKNNKGVIYTFKRIEK